MGLLMGLAAALPFDAARIGGRLVDLVRGTSAEAALPVAGHRESATGDVLYQLLVSLALAGGALPLACPRARQELPAPSSRRRGRGRAGGARAGPAGGRVAGHRPAVAAPVVALSWATDAAVGLALRAAPGPSIGELATPVRILGGAGVLWLSLGARRGPDAGAGARAGVGRMQVALGP